MNFKSYMLADQREPSSKPIDTSPFLGDWYNTHPNSSYLVRVRIEADDDCLVLESYGSDHNEPIPWGRAVATPFAAGKGNVAAGFHCRYVFDEAEHLLVANQKLGILVIQSYTRYLDGSKRTNHFAREFFRRQTAEA